MGFSVFFGANKRNTGLGPGALAGRRRTATTLTEVLIALGLMTVLLVAVWSLFHNFLGRSSKMSVANATSRAINQQQSRLALRKLFYRLQQAIQILEPVPGQTGGTLVFRDMLNRNVRLRFSKPDKMVVAERSIDGAYVKETDTDPESALVKTIQIASCEGVSFTTLSPTTVAVSFSTSDSNVADSFLSVLHLANSRLGP